MLLKKGNTRLIILLLSVFLLEAGCKSRSVESKKHGLFWGFKRNKHKSDGKNPFIKRDKATHAQSRQQKREDDRALKKAKKEYQKGIRRSKRKRLKG